jgi:hypothetical protein
MRVAYAFLCALEECRNAAVSSPLPPLSFGEGTTGAGEDEPLLVPVATLLADSAGAERSHSFDSDNDDEEGRVRRRPRPKHSRKSSSLSQRTPVDAPCSQHWSL